MAEALGRLGFRVEGFGFRVLEGCHWGLGFKVLEGCPWTRKGFRV